MRKKGALILLLVAVMLTTQMVIADDNYGAIYDQIILDIDDSGKDYSFENELIFRNGLERDTNNTIFGTPGVQEYISLKFTHYYQNRQSWSNDIMRTCGSTIGNAGCALTSFTMVTDYYGYSDNPGQVNALLGNLACPIYWTQSGAKYGLTLVGNVGEGYSESYVKTYIRGALRLDRPVIVGFKKGSSTHFVVARAYLKETIDPYEGTTGREYFYIYDPSYGRDYLFVDDYLNEGWVVHSLKVYDN